MSGSAYRYWALVLLVASALTGSFGAAAGQVPSGVRTGSRIRLLFPQERNWIIGNVMDATPARLRVLAQSDTLDVTWDMISRLEISEDRRSHLGTGVIVGAAAGGVVALLLDVMYVFGSAITFRESIDGGKVIAMSAGSVAGGVVVGGVIGALIRTDRWTAATLAGKTITMSAGPGGLVLRLR